MPEDAMLPARRLSCLLLFLTTSCGGAPPPAEAPTASSDALVREARAFMESYAADLRAGAREALVARYDPRGAYFVGNGEKSLLSTQAIHDLYFGRWGPPATFEWQDLSYEAVGPDAVIVTGKFAWGAGGGRPVTLSYTGLLERRDGRLRIRLEDESAAPPPPRPCPPDSARS
jgi:hypothetical protein